MESTDSSYYYILLVHRERERVKSRPGFLSCYIVCTMYDTQPEVVP